MLAVRADDYRALYICALIRDIVLLELFESLLVRMTVIVILAAGYERERRGHDPEELLACRCAAAVVAELQDIRLDIRAVCKYLLLALCLGIARKEERILSVDDFQDDGGIVQVIRRADGADYRYLSVAEGIGSPALADITLAPEALTAFISF